MMGVGMMIGAGVFVTTGIGIGVAGPGGILVALALNGLLAFLSVMTYAELSSAIPRAGAGYSYVQESIGGFTGFFCGWISWFAHTVAGSLYAITLAKYAMHFLAQLELFAAIDLTLPVFEKGLAVAIALVFVYINFRGASETGRAGAIMAVGQTILLAAIAVIGVITVLKNPGRIGNFTPFLPYGWGKVLVVMGFSLVGFEGYEVIANTAEETVDAKKNVPKGIFLAAIIVITTYLLLAFAAVVAVKTSGHSVVEYFQARGATGFADAIAQLFPFGGVCVLLAVIFAGTSALNATIYSSTRIAFALGRDGHLPSPFAHVSETTRIPNVALLCSGTLTIVVAAAFPVEVVCAGASIFFIVLFNIVTLALIRIRKERGDELHYGYLMPFFPLIPLVSFGGHLLIGVFLFDMGALAYIIAAAWVGVGVLLYCLYSRRHARESERSGAVLYRRRGIAPEGYQIMVSIANPAIAPVLVRYANVIAAGKRPAGLMVTSIVTLPYQTPLDEARRFMAGPRNMIHEASRLADDSLHVETTVRYGHSVARGILSAVKDRNPNLLLLGWRGRARWDHFAMGSTLDPVIEQAPCDVIILKVGEHESGPDVRRILLPSRGDSPHVELAVDIAALIAKRFDAEVTVFHVVKQEGSGKEETTATDVISERLQGIRNTVKVAEADDVAAAILAESENHDLVVIGATAESLFQQVLFGSVPVKVARSCTRTVLMVKKDLGVYSWFRRWFS